MALGNKMSLKDFSLQSKKFESGHRSCAGCAFPVIVRHILAASEKPVVVAVATGCLEVVSTIYPYTSWKVPFIHNAFENAAATISGAESAYWALKKKGKIKEDINFIAFGGDGGTYDIGLQSLSGALERGHRLVYVCYDNEGYMNTGGQSSSATPLYASTTTTPSGKKSAGKNVLRKNIMEIVAAHRIPYLAEAAVHNLADLEMKAKKAFLASGPAFLNVFSPCNLNWKFPTALTIKISRLAAETNFWPLYEIENGKYKINYKPAKRVQISEFLKTQERFKHLFQPKENKELIQKVQEEIDKEWQRLNSFL